MSVPKLSIPVPDTDTVAPAVITVSAAAPEATPVTSAASAPTRSTMPSALLGSGLISRSMPVTTLPDAMLLGLPPMFIASSTSALATGASSRMFSAMAVLSTSPSTSVMTIAKLSLTATAAEVGALVNV